MVCDSEGCCCLSSCVIVSIVVCNGMAVSVVVCDGVTVSVVV